MQLLQITTFYQGKDFAKLYRVLPLNSLLDLKKYVCNSSQHQFEFQEICETMTVDLLKKWILSIFVCFVLLPSCIKSIVLNGLHLKLNGLHLKLV